MCVLVFEVNDPNRMMIMGQGDLWNHDVKLYYRELVPLRILTTKTEHQTMYPWDVEFIVDKLFF